MKTDDRLLMKYMQGLCTEKEKDAIDRWLTSSEENRKAFRDAHHIYEGILMSAGPESLRFSARGGILVSFVFCCGTAGFHFDIPRVASPVSAKEGGRVLWADARLALCLR